MNKIKRVKIINKFVKITQSGGEKQSKLSNSFFKLLLLVIFLNLLSFASFGATCKFDSSTGTLTASGKGELSVDDVNSVIVRDKYGKNTTVTTVEIKNDITSIGNIAFNNCEGLTTVIFEENSNLKTINVGAFNSCTNLNNIIIPEGVESIGSGAFDNCTSLSNIIIPNSVTSIGSKAFYNCTKLNNIIIPEGVTSIGIGAFNSCTSLSNIIIPSSVETIGNNAFYNCTELKDVYYLGTKVNWSEIRNKRNNSDLDNVTVHYSKMLTVNKVWDDNKNSSLRSKPQLVLYRVYKNCYKNGEDYYHGSNNKIKYDSSNDYVVDNYNETYTVYKKMVAGKTGKNDEYKQGDFSGCSGDEWQCKILIYDNEEGDICAVSEDPMEGYTSTAPTPQLTTAPN